MQRGKSLHKPIVTLFLFVLLNTLPLRAGFADSFAVGPLADGILAGSSAVLGGASELFFHRNEPVDLGLADINKVNGFDRIAVFGYSRSLDVLSDVSLYTTLAVPAALAFFMSPSDAVSLLVPYFETIALADFSKNALKFAFPRQRPWMYMVASGGATPQTWEGNDSFPSGHTTLAFAAAVFGIFAFTTYFPNSPYLIPFTVLDFGLAVGTSTLRITSGMHFLTDVLAGAAVGAALGALIPLLHQSNAWKSATGQPVSGMEVSLVTFEL